MTPLHYPGGAPSCRAQRFNFYAKDRLPDGGAMPRRDGGNAGRTQQFRLTIRPARCNDGRRDRRLKPIRNISGGNIGMTAPTARLTPEVIGRAIDLAPLTKPLMFIIAVAAAGFLFDSFD